MTFRLEDFQGAATDPDHHGIPHWAQGAFIRRSISFADGSEDRETLVVWVQAGAMTGDLRLPAGFPDSAVPEVSRDYLEALAHGEGGVARTVWQDEQMSWHDWIAYQPYARWPEPGFLRRVGDCLIEFAPSGAYVEDWRLQPDSLGLQAGLKLVAIAGADHVWHPRDGGLVIAGDHAILMLGRRNVLPLEGPLANNLSRTGDTPEGVLADMFDAVCAWAVRAPGEGVFTVKASTNPAWNGLKLDLSGGFETNDAPEILEQSLALPGDILSLRWEMHHIDLMGGTHLATAATPEARHWLKQEMGRGLDSFD